MENIIKQNIATAMRNYCNRYDSQNKAANSLKNVSAATISQVLNGKWDLISDDMWRNLASQIAYTNKKWAAVDTANFTELNTILNDAREHTMVMSITSPAGTGKTFTAKHYAASHNETFLLCCSEYWNRGLFVTELLKSMGKEPKGLSINEKIMAAVQALRTMESPLIIIDEADKLSDRVLYFLITLYNNIEDECGMVLLSTDYIARRFRLGLDYNKMGYAELWSRVGKKCIPLIGVTSSDIQKICEQNGITSKAEINKVIADSESDLRRVKRKIHAIKRSKK